MEGRRPGRGRDRHRGRDDADTTITISEDDFEQLVAGELNPMTAFMTGKLKVKGDMGAAMKLQKLF